MILSHNLCRFSCSLGIKRVAVLGNRIALFPWPSSYQIFFEESRFPEKVLVSIDIGATLLVVQSLSLMISQNCKRPAKSLLCEEGERICKLHDQLES